MLLIKVENLIKCWKYRKGNFTLGPLNIHVSLGDIILVEGSNGSGKSTLLACIGKLMQFDKGIVHWHNSINTKDVLLMNQNYHLICLPWLSCRENISLGNSCNIAKETKSVFISEENPILPNVLKDVLDKPVYTLSDGQKQATILTQVLLANRKVLLLDEPFSNLDAETTLHFLHIIQSKCEARDCACVIAAHHAPKELRNTSIISLGEGKIRELVY